jgi:hypothetical protein
VVEHRLRPQQIHHAVKGLGGGALEEGVLFPGGAHAVHDVHPVQVLVHHGVRRVHIVLEVGVHGDHQIGLVLGSHKARQQGVLMAPVPGQVRPAEQAVLPVEPLNDRPGAVPGAVVDEQDPAAGADFSRGHQAAELVPQAAGGLGENLLLVVAGHHNV